MKREKFMFRFMLAVPQKRKRKEMLFFLINTPISSFNLFKFGMLSINYSRKIGPVVELPDSSQCLADIAQKSCGDGVVHNVWMKPANLTYFDKIKYSNSSLILNV